MTVEQFAKLLANAMAADGFDSIELRDVRAVAASEQAKASLTEDQFSLNEMLADVLAKTEASK